MSIKRRTETKPIERDIDLSPDPDDERDMALERSMLDTAPAFDGEALRPVSAGTIALMQRSGNRLFYGDSTNAMADVAAFVLLHSEETSHEARRAIYRGDNQFDEMVFQFLDAPKMQQKVLEFTPIIAEMMQDYIKTQTVSMGAGSEAAVKKSGRRIG
jgi:hypothetical protein